MDVAWITQDFPAIAQAEIETLAGKSAKQNGDLVFVEASLKGLEKRLAFTKATYTLLFSCTKKGMQKAFEAHDWKITKDFRVTTSRSPLPAPLLGHFIKTKSGKQVNLHTPTNHVMVFGRDKIHVCQLHGENDSQFEERRGRNRPAKHPTTMHPKLARAMVNLTGIKKGTFVDPMCGSGGLLLEAALLGFTCEGVDIDSRLLAKAQQNLQYFGVSSKLTKADSTKLNKKLSHVALDLPYGRGTTRKDLEKTYQAMISMLGRNLKGKAAIMYPHWADVPALVKKAGLSVCYELEAYSHRLLTRKIVIAKR